MNSAQVNIHNAPALLEAVRLCDWPSRRELLDLLNAGQDQVDFGKDSKFMWREEAARAFERRAHCKALPGTEHVDVAVNGVIFTLHSRQPGLGFMRLFLHCPVCAKVVPVGRMHQHAPVHFPAKVPVRAWNGQRYEPTGEFRRPRYVRASDWSYLNGELRWMGRA